MGLFDAIGQRYNYMRRYNHIAAVLLKYGFEDAVAYLDEKKRFTFLKRLIPNKTLGHSLRYNKWEKMRMVCEELGPTFVKFGQILSNRPDLLPNELIIELEKLQDGVPPVPGKEAIAVVEKELEKPMSELFESFEAEAFASASMAQVHKAVLKTGEKVVIKIQRPGIKDVIESDIKIMYAMAEIFTRRIPSLKSFEPVALVKNFEDSILKELDFVHESINLQRFGLNYETDKHNEGHVYIPQVYRDHTAEKVITLELISGIKVSDISNLQKAGIAKETLAEQLINTFLKQVFNYGFFHADPHAGNIIIKPNGQICFIDYGMMGAILKKDLELLASLILSVKNKDTRKLIKALTQLSDSVVIRNLRELEADLNEFVNNYEISNLHAKELSTLMLQLKDIIVKHKLKVPTHFYLLARSIAAIEGVARQLDPKLDMIQMAKPFMFRLIAKHYNPLQFGKRVLNSFYEMGMYMEEFPRDLKNAMRKINTGEIKVDLQHKGIDPLVHTLNRISKQVVSAVIVGSLIVGSSLIIVAGTPPKFDGISGLGLTGLILALVIGLGMLRNLSKGDHDH